jgi:hypothetical protein
MQVTRVGLFIIHNNRQRLELGAQSTRATAVVVFPLLEDKLALSPTQSNRLDGAD